MKYTIKQFIFGALIGASILIPGLSGGTTAVILGIYFQIFESVNSLKKDFKKSICLLLPLALGGIIGIMSVSRPIAYITEHYPVMFSYFISGIILGSILPFKNELSNFKINKLFFLLSGVFLVLIFDGLSGVLFISEYELLNYLIIGFISATALILPGISLSNALIAFGCYDAVINALNTFDILYLLKLFISISVSSLILAHSITTIYKKYPTSINLMILGMIIASVKQAFIRFPLYYETLPCLLLFFLGFGIVYFAVTFEKNTNAV